jgi:hypothetical protein
MTETSLEPVEYHHGAGLGELLSPEEGRRRLAQYRAGQRRGQTVLSQMPEGFSRAAWMCDPKHAPETRDDDAFKAGYWSVGNGH